MRYWEILSERETLSSIDVVGSSADRRLILHTVGGHAIEYPGKTSALLRRRQAILIGDDPEFAMKDYPSTIDWTVPRLARHDVARGVSEVVWIDPAALDADFIQTGFYVGPKGSGGIGERYREFDGWVRQGHAVEMPEAYFDAAGKISFENGRHRFAWMRDHAARSLPLVVPSDQAGAFQDRYGAASRETVVEGLVDSIKKVIGDKADQAVTTVKNTVSALQVLYKAIANPTYLSTTVVLLRKSIGSKLKLLSQKFPTNTVVKKFSSIIFKLRPTGSSVRDMLKCLGIACILNSVTVLAKLAGDGMQVAVAAAMKTEYGASLKHKVTDLVSGDLPGELAGYLSAIGGKIMGIDRLVGAVMDAHGFFALMKGLGVANELLFRELTQVGQRISAVRIGAGAV